MTFLNEIVNFEYESEYANEYDLSLKPKFSTPKIQSYKGNLKKRWYVYYSYRNPETGKMKRISPIYASANKFKTKEDRMTILTKHRPRLQQQIGLVSSDSTFNLAADLDGNSVIDQRDLALFNQQSVASRPVISAMSGLWYDPSHDGEGWDIQILDQNSAFVTWYTYDGNGRHRNVHGRPDESADGGRDDRPDVE